MILELSSDLIAQIHAHGEYSYPEEGAGLLLGRADESRKRVEAVYKIANAREDSARHNRYLITPQNMLAGEDEAAHRGLDVVGVFHSHPDHPSRPSEYDREWALPWYSYLITSVLNGKAETSRSWRLDDDRSLFTEEELVIYEV